ncbi:hypothetical protein [Streptomyces sp. HUAS TT20]|uniref:hypothetical protein n=1 Tax=Streptomyces sp. HUAS TT20 TaxID=3447509 RepID=UPI0021D8F81D|nr:hypothetical protein [Streptomyces sp. HUAS 15-9]UXY32922.1 hypothetical protein N8I87_24100 [Streptomyces sp. HUAS 15-9]
MGHRGVGRDRAALCTAAVLPVLAARAVPAGVEQHPVVAPHVAVLLALRQTPGQPVGEDLRCVRGRLVLGCADRSVPDLVPALERVVTEACADLGYRLFLRTMKAYFVEIDQDRCDTFTALGERFGYPEFLVDDNLNVR